MNRKAARGQASPRFRKAMRSSHAILMSFYAEEEGALDHQDEMSDVPPPETFIPKHYPGSRCFPKHRNSFAEECESAGSTIRTSSFSPAKSSSMRGGDQGETPHCLALIIPGC